LEGKIPFGSTISLPSTDLDPEQGTGPYTEKGEGRREKKEDGRKKRYLQTYMEAFLCEIPSGLSDGSVLPCYLFGNFFMCCFSGEVNKELCF
jgi:hypothetical protein